MEWVPDSMWFTYLRSTPAGQLDYDLAISTQPHVAPSLQDVGLRRSQTVPLGAVEPADETDPWSWPAAVTGTLVGAGILGVVLLAALVIRRRSSEATP